MSLLAVETGASRSMRTNVSGFYAFSNLPPGIYQVSVEQPGFRKEIRTGIDLTPNHTVRVDVPLEPGQVTTSVEVASRGALLQTDRADISHELGRKQVADMPLGYNRNFVGLLALVPGVQRPTRPSSQFYNPQDALSFNVNGGSTGSSNIEIDGVDNNQNIGYQSTYVPSVESIEVVNVSTGNYDAELGRSNGAVVSVTLRSGTNHWHGGAWEFLQNDVTSARNYFAYPTATQPKPVAPLRYNLFGGNLGGPVKKDKLFIFATYEGIRKSQGTIQVMTLPSNAWRNGNLSDAPTTIYDPATGNADGTGRQPFPTNTVPSGRISSLSTKILGYVPLPNMAGLLSNFSVPNVLVRSTNTIDIKSDYVPTQYDHLTFRFSSQRAVSDDPPMYYPAGGPNLFSAKGPQQTFQANIGHNHTFSPTLITEARIGFTRWNNVAKQYDYGTTPAKELGIPNLNLTEYSSGFPNVEWGGVTDQLTGYSRSLPWYRGENHYQWANNWTKIAGNHLLKWGVDIRRTQDWLLSPSGGSPRGWFSFFQGTAASPADSKSLSGIANSFAALLLDMPTIVNRAVTPILPATRQTMVFAFIQDKWEVLPKLTLDLGVRWEFWPFLTPANPGGFSQYDPNTNNLVLAGLGGNPLNLGIPNNYRRFEPRVGLAYRINQKTVFRAAYGITTPPGYGFVNAVGSNFPVAQINNFTQANPYGPAIGPDGPLSMRVGIPLPQVAAFPSSGIIPANSSVLLNSSFANIYTPDYHLGYHQFWNATLQRTLPGRSALTVAYVGKHFFGYGGSLDINVSMPGTGRAGQPLYQKYGRPASTSVIIEGPGSNYHALNAKFDRPFANGLLLTSAFTWGKMLGCPLSNPWDWKAYCGRNAIDQKFNFVQSFLYEVPFGSGRRWLHSGVASWALRGWQFNGVFTSGTGLSMNFSASASLLNAVGVAQRPDVLYKPAILGGVGPGQLWFDTKAFALPAALKFGNTGTNILDSPGLVNLDASIFRRFPIAERIKGELRAESFNLTNTPHFNAPNTSFGNAAFGQITSAVQDQRTFQLGLKLSF